MIIVTQTIGKRTYTITKTEEAGHDNVNNGPATYSLTDNVGAHYVTSKNMHEVIDRLTEIFKQNMHLEILKNTP